MRTSIATPGIIVAIRWIQSAVSLELNGVRLAITSTVSDNTAVNCDKSLKITPVAVYTDRNSYLNITFALDNLPVLLECNQNTTSWQPVELSQTVFTGKDSFRLMATCWQSVYIYKLNSSRLQTY